MQIVSDTHGKRLKHFLNPLSPILVLAGDIGWDRASLVEQLVWASQHWTQVFYVPGNHEYYHSLHGFKRAKEDISTLLENEVPSNVHLFDIPNIAFLGSQRVIGCTLWSKVTNRYNAKAISDYQFFTIEELNNEHIKHVEFLTNNILEGDIVLTHHLPSYLSVDPVYKGDYLSEVINECFYTDLEGLILETKPKLWIHGHTHQRCDYMLGNTRIVCNPYGYKHEAFAWENLIC